jgi:transposase
MMGPVQERKPALFHYGINLEKRVRSDNPLRRVRELVNFGFVREVVRDGYGKKGHKSEDPIVILKLMLLLFMDDVASERKLMAIVGERLDYMWFLEFELDEEIPNHSVLSKARRRWGRKVFEDLFIKIVRQCVETGIVDGKKIHMDGSLVDANASKESVRKGPAELIEALRAVYQKQEKKLESEIETDVAAGSEAKPGSEDFDGSVGGQTAEFAIVSRSESHRGRSKCEFNASVSKTDPDAAFIKKGIHDAARPRYKSHRVVDDHCGVITAVQTTAADVTENSKLMDLVQQHETNTERVVHTIVADAQYGTNDNFEACQQRGIRSHMADLKSVHQNSSERPAIFEEDRFRYDEQSDSYICPAGQQLRRISFEKDRKRYIYGISAKICKACALHSMCTRSNGNRTIKRHLHHDALSRARIESHSGFAKRDRRRRKHLMEGSFGDAANNHGFKRARWRRLQNQQIQDWLIASCQNIRILIGCSKPRLAKAIAMPLIEKKSLVHNRVALPFLFHALLVKLFPKG